MSGLFFIPLSQKPYMPAPRRPQTLIPPPKTPFRGLVPGIGTIPTPGKSPLPSNGPPPPARFPLSLLPPNGKKWDVSIHLSKFFSKFRKKGRTPLGVLPFCEWISYFVAYSAADWPAILPQTIQLVLARPPILAPPPMLAPPSSSPHWNRPGMGWPSAFST